jgi:hypothetical protein
MFIPDPTFFHPRSELSPSRIPDPGFGSASKNLSILTPKNQKNGFYALANMIRVVHPGTWIPDLDADFLPIPDP